MMIFALERTVWIFQSHYQLGQFMEEVIPQLTEYKQAFHRISFGINKETGERSDDLDDDTYFELTVRLVYFRMDLSSICQCYLSSYLDFL